MARNSGDGSWYDLLKNIYNKNIIAVINNAHELEGGIKISPLANLRGGNYYRIDGSRVGRGLSGNYWESNIHNATSAKYLGFSDNRFGPQDASNKGFGFSVRCGDKFML